MTADTKAVLKQLARIADALETIVLLHAGPEQSQPETEPATCQHLDRVFFSATEWECPTCRHHEPAP